MKKWIWFVVLIYIGFIFYNSSLIGTTSRNNSDPITSFMLHLFNLSVSFDFLSLVIRKLAHFCEYALLGCLLFVAEKKSPLPSIQTKMVYFLFLIIPVIDEIIQFFTEGRSCEIKDMLLDSLGYLCGLLFATLVFNIIQKRRNT